MILAESFFYLGVTDQATRPGSAREISPKVLYPKKKMGQKKKQNRTENPKQHPRNRKQTTRAGTAAALAAAS
jgi:hypothetical protein